MAKRLKSKAGNKPKSTSSQVMESANQIWLAGLGAFAKAQQEGQKVFDTLVEQGKSFESDTKKATSERVDDVKNAVDSGVSKVTDKAGETWDKLETVFEDRVARTLNRLGVPSGKEIRELADKVDALNKEVHQLRLQEGAAKPAAKQPAARKATTARKPAARKTAASKTSTAKKTTTTKKTTAAK